MASCDCDEHFKSVVRLTLTFSLLPSYHFGATLPGVEFTACFFTTLLAWVGVPSFVQAIAMFAIYWKDFSRFGSFSTSLYSILSFVDAKQLLIQQPPKKKKKCEEREKDLLLPIWKPSSLLKPVPISQLQSSSNRAEKYDYCQSVN